MNRSLVIWLAVLVLQLFVAITVAARTVNLFSLIAWLSSISIAVKIFLGKSSPQKHHDVLIPIILAISQLGILGYFSSLPTHYHQDEFITAYTSWTLPPINKLDWFAVYPPVWVSQFPVLFHIFQKPFFFFLGPTVEAV